MIKNKKLQWALFCLMAIAQLAVPTWMIINKKSTIAEGTVYKFELEAIDPHDPFRGKYIILRPKANSFNIILTEQTKQKNMYATFEEDSLGYAQIKKLHREKPTQPDYLYVQTEGMVSKGNIFPVTIIYPFERYYMNEDKAKAAEVLTQAVARDSTRTSYAEVAIHKGDATILSVKVDGTPIEALINQDSQ